MNRLGPDTRVLRRGLMLVLSSPSGAGKTTLSRLLLENEKSLELSISVTTREPRPGEREGVDYYFLPKSKFDDMRDGGALLEWAEVFDHQYGTPRGAVEEALAAGRDMLFDIDWQGGQQLAENMKNDLVRVFILPPSASDLEQRLNARAQDPSDVVARRMAGASEEISHWEAYDYVLINDDVGTCLETLTAILHAERQKRVRLTGLTAFVRAIQDDLG